MLLACPGLDHARRGFETFARECFEALGARSDITVELVKGTGGRTRNERAVPTVTRDDRVARMAGRGLLGPLLVEQMTFFVGLLPLLRRRPPDVVYFSEWHLGRVLAAWRRFTRQRYALAFCNGALAPGGYGHLDLVQQIAAGGIEYTVSRGEARERQQMLPLGVAIESEPTLLDDSMRSVLRRRLGLPEERLIVLSVGAINRQKRMDYVIEEIAATAEPRPYLLIVGQPESETPAIRTLAARRLGAEGCATRTVSPDEMPALYRASDVFVLASLWESFGRVLVEALSHGLPCLAHDYPVMNWVLGEQGETADLRRPGAVRAWLEGLDATEFSESRRRSRHRSAYERFSWDRLADP